ncbi:hypothetical protein F0U44_12040 [Nocardioides humilatus]|uniref:Uncharacterized protein n=1 Tax=Nocardioides humilatus TaxID=2607660 RepID=A0A5B1LEV1_9ACTN|nr:hypothetical protein [Nocardioides humilatus]KAA1419175.1 hypothetical protein F0U44_12040 [Nocardioides humilatus]
MVLVDEAERRGDARGALELIDDLLCWPDGRVFWRPQRVLRLTQLAYMAPWLPRWATSRWLLEQACQELGPDRRRAYANAIEIAAEVRGGLSNVRCPEGEDPRIKLTDHDWVFRQCILYEFGGLASFLTRASADLLADADRIEEWVMAPMGGYRLVGRAPAITTWEDLASRRMIETPNIGSAALLVVGECAIGRLVPIEGGRMFETVPLEVSEDVAIAVSHSPDDWVQILRDARRRGVDVVNRGCEFGFLSDVPTLVSAMTFYESRDAFLADSNRKAVLAAADRAFVEDPLEDPDAVDLWACVASEVLRPTVFGLSAGLNADEVRVIARLGRTLAEPAAQFCRDLAAAAREAA